MTRSPRARVLPHVALVVALALGAALLGPSAAAHPPHEHPAAPAPPREPGEADVVPGEVILRWASAAPPASRAAARGDHGVVHARSMPRTGVELHTITSGRPPAEVALDMTRDPRVEYAQPNYRLFRHAPPPDDPGFGELWGLHNTGQTIRGQPGVAGVDVDVLDAWDHTRGEDLVVAVIDEGTDRDHPDLGPNMWVNPDPGSDPRYPDDLHGWDFLNDDNTVFDAVDGDDHGTHVSGTVAAVADNGVGIAGVAPEATIMPLKFLGPGGGDTADAILAIEYAADRGVRVSNNSWAAPGVSPALRDAIANSGMAFVAAAGNAAQDLDADPTFPCAFDLPNVLCVAALDNRGELASYSNFGVTTVHVGAPGSAVLSTVPRSPDRTVALQIEAPAYDAMFWGFDLSDVEGGPTTRAEILGAALDHLGTTGADPILLVDDDESDRGVPSHPDVRPLYTQALVDAGHTDVDVHNVAPNADGPSAAQMAGNTVIWFTGNAFGAPGTGITTLTPADRDSLATFLGDGGRLLLAGADAIWQIEDSAFVRDWLHADFVAEITGRAGLQGGPGSVYAGQVYDLVANSFIKHVEPRSGAATAALAYPGAATYTDAYSYFNGTSMASPHAAGVAALVAALRPDLAAPEIVDLVTDTVVALPSLAGATTTGGMVNAAAAATAALAGLTEAAPGPPHDVSAVAGDGAASVSWSPPAFEGGGPITGYTVVAQPGGATTTVGGDTHEATVTGLTNGQAYTFTVRATNAIGDGPLSAPSAPVTPRGVPGAPTGVSATAGDAQATVSWSAPDDDGGSPITGYTVTATPGGASVSVGASAREATVAGLTNQQTYRFTVHASNAVGDGPASPPSNAVTPAAGEACPSSIVPGAGFTDVAAGNVHAAAIDCAAWYGLAQGTTATTFAPGASVRRDQMAAFIGRLIAEAGVQIEGSGAPFDDVDGNVHADHINALAAAGIVQGVAPGTYAPGARVTRDQMASFLTRSYEFIAEQTLPAPPHGFADVAGNVHETAIAKAAGAEFARGLTESTYGPRQAVRRDQMASFLTRVLQRLVEDGSAQARS